MQAYLCVDTWAGRREYPVEVVKETEKRYKIRLNGNEILPGDRVEPKGTEIYVPKYAIKVDRPTPKEAREELDRVALEQTRRTS
jgi:hypothetical protein